MEKLKPREKVLILFVLFLMRWLVPKRDMDEDVSKLSDDIIHQVRCHL